VPGVPRPGATTIPNHALDDLKPDEWVAIPARGAEIHLHLHPATEGVRAFASGQGSEVLATHMRDKDASRERNVGGEG
jgi:hypothetical protein